jgi:hypothetical protein
MCLLVVSRELALPLVSDRGNCPVYEVYSKDIKLTVFRGPQ